MISAHSDRDQASKVSDGAGEGLILPLLIDNDDTDYYESDGGDVADVLN